MSYQMTLQDSSRYLSGEYDYEVVGGDTIYYHNHPDVSSTNNLGSVASGNFLARAAPSWVVSAGTSYIAQRERAGTTDPSLVEPADGAGSFYNAATRTFEMVTPTEAEGDPYDVRDYGATGDGSTDDTAAIQAALDACEAAGGGEVYVPRGTFIVDGCLAIASYTHLRGAGAGSAILKMADDTTASSTEDFPYAHQLILSNKDAKAAGVTDIEISGLVFDGNTDNNHLNEWTHAIEFWGAVNVNIHDCQANNVRGEFVAFSLNATTQNKRIQISNCRLYDVGNVHSSETPGAGHAARQGIAVISGEDIAITNIVGENIGGHLIDLEPDGASDVVRNISIGNIVGRECGTDGLAVGGLIGLIGSSSSHVSNVTATNLNLYSNESEGYFPWNLVRVRYADRWDISGAAAHCLLTGPGVQVLESTMGTLSRIRLTQTASHDSSGTYSAIYLEDCSQTLITGCTINNSGAAEYKYAVEESGSTYYTTIVGNHLLAPGTVGTVLLAGTTSRCRHYSGTIPSLASAASLSLPAHSDLILVTGTISVTSIGSLGAWPGRVVTLYFDSSITITDGSNLLLAGDFNATANDTLTLASDGTNWREISRSAN